MIVTPYIRDDNKVEMVNWCVAVQEGPTLIFADVVYKSLCPMPILSTMAVLTMLWYRRVTFRGKVVEPGMVKFVQSGFMKWRMSKLAQCQKLCSYEADPQACFISMDYVTEGGRSAMATQAVPLPSYMDDQPQLTTKACLRSWGDEKGARHVSLESMGPNDLRDIPDPDQSYDDQMISGQKESDLNRPGGGKLEKDGFRGGDKDWDILQNLPIEGGTGQGWYFVVAIHLTDEAASLWGGACDVLGICWVQMWDGTFYAWNIPGAQIMRGAHEFARHR